jgi:hypothetical protein
MSYLFNTKSKLPTVSGTAEIVSEGVRALEALPALIESLGDDAGISEIQIWENTAITASIYADLTHTSYGWNGKRWVEVAF